MVKLFQKCTFSKDFFQSHLTSGVYPEKEDLFNFILDKYNPTVYIEYIKTPAKVTLTFEDLNKNPEDSQVLEFPDYVCYEIVNIFVRLVMENASNPRLQTNMPINNTITGPDDK